MGRQQFVLISIFIGMTVLVQGCIVAAVGAGAVGTVAYVKGDLESVESHSIDTVYEATLQAMNDLDLYVTLKFKDALTAEINARDTQDSKVTIKLNSQSEGITKLSIRVGIFGEETKSQLIYNKIRDNLPK